MTAPVLLDADIARPPWWRALHAALMPDYNRKAATYWWLMLLFGLGALTVALVQLSRLPLAAQAQVAIGCAAAMLAGMPHPEGQRTTCASGPRRLRCSC